MNAEDKIRYIGFRPTADCGRRFEFSVKCANQASTTVVMDIPGAMFAGANRIMVQEGAGICMAKLRSICALAGSDSLPAQVSLTEVDIQEHREIIVLKERTPWGTLVDRPRTQPAEEESPEP